MVLTMAMVPAIVMEDMAMVIVLAMTTVMAIMVIPVATATITMAMDIPTEITIVAGLVIVDHGVDPGAGDDLKSSEATSSILNLELERVTPNMDQKMARSGCCSWHGGVCDCIGGRAVCCDGTFSPSCTCHHDSDKDVLNSKE